MSTDNQAGTGFDVGACCDAALWVEQDQLLCVGPARHDGDHYATVYWSSAPLPPAGVG